MNDNVVCSILKFKWSVIRLSSKWQSDLALDIASQPSKLQIQYLRVEIDRLWTENTDWAQTTINCFDAILNGWIFQMDSSPALHFIWMYNVYNVYSCKSRCWVGQIIANENEKFPNLGHLVFLFVYHIQCELQLVAKLNMRKRFEMHKSLCASHLYVDPDCFLSDCNALYNKYTCTKCMHDAWKTNFSNEIAQTNGIYWQQHACSWPVRQWFGWAWQE